MTAGAVIRLAVLLVRGRLRFIVFDLRLVGFGLKVREVDGYFVFEAQRRGPSYANRRGFIK